MAITINPISQLPLPVPTKADPVNFAVRADAHVAALPLLVTQINAMINEVNKITSGLDQTEPIVAWQPDPASYSFPTCVAGEDGNTYRCLDVDVVNINPVTDNGTYWLKLTNNTPVIELPPASAYVEIGDVLISLSPTLRTGFMLCNGAAISRTTYSALFARIGTVWGSGNGSTTFNIPDFRDDFLRGASGTRALASRASDTFRAHNHSGSTNSAGDHSHSYERLSPSGVMAEGSHTMYRHPASASTSGGGSHSHSVSIGNTGGAETAPRHICVNFIIRVL